MSSLDESKRSNRRRECLCIYSETGPRAMAHTISAKKKNTAPSFFLSFRLAIGKSVNVRLARQTRVFKIWVTSSCKKKKKRRKRKTFTGSSLKTAPQSRSGKEVVQLDHLKTLNYFFILFFFLLFGLNNSGWDARENPAWFRWKTCEGKKKKNFEVGNCVFGQRFSWNIVRCCCCVYTLEKCLRVSLNLWLSRGAFREWRYIVKRVEGLMAAELMALSVGRRWRKRRFGVPLN